VWFFLFLLVAVRSGEEHIMALAGLFALSFIGVMVLAALGSIMAPRGDLKQHRADLVKKDVQPQRHLGLNTNVVDREQLADWKIEARAYGQCAVNRVKTEDGEIRVVSFRRAVNMADYKAKQRAKADKAEARERAKNEAAQPEAAHC
jgi:hypothetical protein